MLVHLRDQQTQTGAWCFHFPEFWKFLDYCITSSTFIRTLMAQRSVISCNMNETMKTWGEWKKDQALSELSDQSRMSEVVFPSSGAPEVFLSQLVALHLCWLVNSFSTPASKGSQKTEEGALGLDTQLFRVLTRWCGMHKIQRQNLSALYGTKEKDKKIQSALPLSFSLKTKTLV